MGQKNSSDWLPSGRHQKLEFPLVRQQQGFPGDAQRRTPRSRVSEAQACPRFRRSGADRASGEERPRYRLFRPSGVVIGKKGEDIEATQRSSTDHGRSRPCLHRGDPQAELDAQLIADSIAQQLESASCSAAHEARHAERHALGAQGIKVMSAGRLNGARNRP